MDHTHSGSSLPLDIRQIKIKKFNRTVVYRPALVSFVRALNHNIRVQRPSPVVVRAQISGQLPPCAGQMPWLEEFKLQANNVRRA